MGRTLHGRVRRDDLEGRRARADAILRAAGELIERWGYDKTTVDDIATAAGVAKGTIYLHWKTRDQLFLSLLRRERVALVGRVRRELDECTSPASVHTLFSLFAEGIVARPLLRGMLLRDMAVIGRLAAERVNRPHDMVWRSEFISYLATLHELGAIRDDWDSRQVTNLINAALLGVFTNTNLLPQEHRLTDTERAGLAAEMISRSLDPGRRLTVRTRAAVAEATVHYLDAALTAAQHQLDESYGLTPSETDQEQK